MKTLLGALLGMLIVLALWWGFWAYVAADAAWPITALSWSDPDHRWFFPPDFRRLCIVAGTMIVAFAGFIAGGVVGESA